MPIQEFLETIFLKYSDFIDKRQLQNLTMILFEMWPIIFKKVRNLLFPVIFLIWLFFEFLTNYLKIYLQFRKNFQKLP